MQAKYTEADTARVSEMTAREIVTIQCGHFANFVGAHWWNIQESSFIYSPQAQTSPKEINHDVLFREGQTLHGEVTYTPRLVAVDLKGSLKSLRREGTLYEAGQEEEVKWDADVSLHEANPIEKNDFLEDLDKVEAEQVQVSESMVGNDDSDKKPSQNTAPDEDDRGEAVFGRKLYNLDSSVSVWSDFLRLHLHPKSLHIVQDYIHNSDEQPFDVFNFGSNVLKNVEVMDTLENRIRFFVEECDSLQGFHTLMDWCDGFGGVGTTMMQYLQDEFSNKARFTCGVSSAVLPDSTARQRANRIINCALCLDKGGNLSSLFVPLSLSDALWKTVGPAREFPYLNYKKDLNYHTSGILAATLDTMSLPYRRDSYSTHLSDITGSFNNLGRKVAALHSSLPFPLGDQSTFVESLLSYKGQAPWFSLTPNVHTVCDPYMQSCVVRGIPSSRINSTEIALEETHFRCDTHAMNVKASGMLQYLRTFDKTEPMVLALDFRRSGPSVDIPGILSGCTSVDEILQLYMTEMYPQCLNAGCVVRDPCKVVSPFPHIFSDKVAKTGLISDIVRPSYQGVDSIPMMTSLQSSSALYDPINTLHKEASRFDIKKHHRYLEAGLEEDEFKETLESLASLSQCYMSDTSIS